MDKENQPQPNLASNDHQKVPPSPTTKPPRKFLNVLKSQEKPNGNPSSFKSRQLPDSEALFKTRQTKVSSQAEGLNQHSVELSTSLSRSHPRHQFKSSVCCNIYVKKGILSKVISVKRQGTQIKSQYLNKRKRSSRLSFCGGNWTNDLNNFKVVSEDEWNNTSDTEKMASNHAIHQIDGSTCAEALKRRQRVLNNLDSIRQKTENFRDMSNISEIAENCLKEKEKKELEKQIQQEENETDDQGFYQNLEHLGAGAHGKVTRQLHVPTRKFYAFKELKVEDDEKKERMAKHEFLLLKTIQNANVSILLQIKDLKCPPNFFARMEYGFGTLYNFLKFCKRKRLLRKWTDDDILTLYFQLWSQLQILEQLNIFHSDIKPENIIISSEGFFVISDFGVSILLEKLGRQELSIQGTPYYYMPELKKARDEGRWSCEYNPIKQDNFALKKIINDIIFRRNPSDSLKKLLARANITKEDYELFTARNSLPIYDKTKKAYHIYLWDQYYKGHSWNEKEEIISHLIEYCHFDQINPWLEKKIEEQNTLSQEYVYLCFLKGRALAIQGKYQKAIESYKICENTLSKLQSQADSKYTACIYSEIGEVAVRNYDFEEARKYIDKSLKIKIKDGNQAIELAQDYWNLAVIDSYEGNREDAVEKCQKGLKLFEQKNKNIHFIGLKNVLGVALETLGRYDQAEEIYQDLLKLLYQNYGEKHILVCRVLGNLAMIFDSTGRPKDALSYNLRSLKMNEEEFLKGDQAFAYSLIDMTVCYAYLGELGEALHCACESIRFIQESKNNNPYIFTWMITIAEICVALKQYETGKDYLYRYLDAYEKMATPKDKLFLQECSINWDFYVYKRKDHDYALRKFQKRWAYLTQKPEAHLVEAFVRQRLALIEILNEKSQDALEHLGKAHEIIENNLSFFSQSEIDLDKFFESNSSSRTKKSSKDLKVFCGEYYDRYVPSLMVAPKRLD